MASEINNFLKRLTAETGLYGDELFERVEEAVKNYDPNQKRVERMVEVLNTQTAEEVKETFAEMRSFRGTKQELLDWAKPYMSEADYGLLSKWKSSMAHGYFAQSVAAAMGLKNFTWIHNARGIDKNGELRNITVEYAVFWDDKTKSLNWGERSTYSVSPM